ncbi:hypothetical protein J6TS7_32950 [Paenibacillus dendritiformis]|nr:hypothetical protein J6TS7_32950 [Paenibacillus dendritiformis]
MKWQWHKIAMAVVMGAWLVTGCGNGSGSQGSLDGKQQQGQGGADSTSAQPTAEKSAPKKKSCGQ